MNQTALPKGIYQAPTLKLVLTRHSHSIGTDSGKMTGYSTTTTTTTTTTMIMQIIIFAKQAATNTWNRFKQVSEFVNQPQKAWANDAKGKKAIPHFLKLESACSSSPFFLERRIVFSSFTPRHHHWRCGSHMGSYAFAESLNLWSLSHRGHTTWQSSPAV